MFENRSLDFACTNFETSSFDQIGPIARTVDDARRIYEVIFGADPRDATSVDRPRGKGTESLEGVRIGVPDQFFPAQLDDEVKGAVERAVSMAEQRGAVRVPISLRLLATISLWELSWVYFLENQLVCIQKLSSQASSCVIFLRSNESITVNLQFFLTKIDRSKKNCYFRQN